jgi:hypothetical protein
VANAQNGEWLSSKKKQGRGRIYFLQRDVRFWPILLKKSVLPDCPILTAEKRLFARSYAKSEPGNPLLKVKISISSVYFSTMETMADFFNRIGR